MKTKLLTFGLVALFIGCGQETSSKTASNKPAEKATISTEVAKAPTETASIKESVDVENGGLRHVDLMNENNIVLSTPRYIETMPGESVKIERSFENAPPLISHSIDGLVPITADNNQCTVCHDKSLAKDVGATAIPPSHYVEFRTHKSTGDSVSSERFNCTQCHVPQSDAKIVIGNSFRPSFSNDALKSSSNLLDVLNEGVE